MARKVNRLTARTVSALRRSGRHADGAGLYLSISLDGATVRRRWVFLFRWHGKLKEMGLGGATTVSLAKARELAAKWRAEVAAGRNPLKSREAELNSREVAHTFGEVAESLYETKSHAWRNEKVRKQWLTLLERYASHLISMPVSEIDAEDVLSVLQPIWMTKSETASRLRGRIEAVLDAARARGLCPPNQANPARWRGHLSHLLCKRRKLTRGHHPAMAFSEVPAFIADLRKREATAAFALEFLILTASRRSEVLGARWSELDLDTRVWTIPGYRMKGARVHRVPLSNRAIEIVATMNQTCRGDFVFPGVKPGCSLSSMAMEMLLRRMQVENATVHGFRSSFRDWCGETTNFPRELAEAALAHVAGDETERAYRRGDALAKRRQLLDAWARFCEPRTSGNVIRIKASAS